MNKPILYILSASMITGTLIAQVEPGAGKWKTWVIPSGSAFRLPAPPDSEITARELRWVKDCISQRDQASLAAIHFWDAGSPGYRWMQLAEHETIAQHDATLACWDTKYTYLELRPSQADPTIPTLFANPQHPGYPSGHACASGASAAVMSALFPNDAPLFTAIANNAGTSTFDAGIHTPLDVSDGLKLGTQVGQKIAARASADGAN